MTNNDKKDNQIDNSILKHGVLNKDLYDAYTINKVQKITKALYLVTNFFDTREPIKWSIRDLSVKFVQHSMSISYASLSSREKSLNDFVSVAQELDILMDTACASGFVSQMNAEVIKRELKSLVVFVEDKHEMHYSTSSRLLLTPSYFKAEDVKSFITGSSDVSGSVDKKSVSKHLNKIDQSFSLRDNKISVSNPDAQDRRRKVIDIGRNLDLFSIKDISSQIQDCSEKTIQRLLIDMVTEGVLEKEGERRWSRYKIAK